jgi:hypothetical protein
MYVHIDCGFSHLNVGPCGFDNLDNRFFLLDITLLEYIF